MDKELLLKQIDNLFLELGFSKISINNKITYFKEEEYIRVDYINGFESFVLEYAQGIEEALNNVFEDGDLYPIKLGINEIIEMMKIDLLK